MKKMEFADRKFKFWFYQVQHSEAIIRSTKVDLDKAYNTNIDIYFGDITYIEIPCLLQELQIDKATEEDMMYLEQKLGKNIPAKKIVVLVSEGKRYYIVASIIKIMENDLDYGVLPIYTFISNREK